MIYTITTFYMKQDRQPGPDWYAVERKRTVGYTCTFEEAQNILFSGWGELSENRHYNHTVIEEVEPGLYPVGSFKFRRFYKFNENGDWVFVENFDDPIPGVASYHSIG